MNCFAVWFIRPLVVSSVGWSVLHEHEFFVDILYTVGKTETKFSMKVNINDAKIWNKTKATRSSQR